jgi:nuclear pore complex protein Nup133
MFTPSANSRAGSLRPKRTRQNTTTEDSISLPQAKRKRSALRRDTFEPLADASINEISSRQDPNVKPNGHVGSAAISSQGSKELSYRGPKNERRTDRSQAPTTLTSNDFYTVSELPSLPQQVRDLDKQNKSYTCTFSVEHGYALAVSHTQAIIWPYHSSASVPSSRDVINIPLSFLQTSETDPVPLATFTAKSATGEPGLLVVSARWGTIVYWDTLTNASTIMPGRTSNGVQGTIPNLGSDTVTDLVSAEPSGFVLSLTHGRVAHVSVRDQLGRPAIGVQFLRKPADGSLLGSFGGSVRNLVGWDRRRGTPLVKAGNASKGQRDVIIMTEAADVELWDTHVGVGHSMLFHQNVLEHVKAAISPNLSIEKTLQQYDIQVVDFELARPGPEVARGDEPAHVPLVVLAAAADSDGTQYYILEMVVSAEDVLVRIVHPLTCYTTKARRHPRIAIAKSTAFVIFDTAVILYSLAKFHESPSSQLLMERQALPSPFQDAIQLDSEKSFKFVGHRIEDDDREAVCLVAVTCKGLLRIQSHKNDVEVDVDEYTSKISAKSRIEQAIQFAWDKKNPLDLANAPCDSYSQEEIEKAALDISNEVVTSTSKVMPKSYPSTAEHLNKRAECLKRLIEYLLKNYWGKVGESLRFQLLFNAEKVAAAQAVWRVQESIYRRYQQEKRSGRCHLEFSLYALHETRHKAPDEAQGQEDSVRHWLLSSVDRCQHLLVEVVDCARELPEWDITDPRVLGEYYLETVDLWMAGFTAAFKFREENAVWYGLENLVLEDGVFVGGYPGDIDRPWTSNVEPNKAARLLLSLVCEYLEEWYDYNPDSKGKKKKMPVSSDGKVHDAPPRALVNELATKLPRQCALFIRVATEEIVWAVQEEEAEYDDPIDRAAHVDAVKAELPPRKRNAIVAISAFNMEGAIDLAERLKDPELLVNLTAHYLQRLNLEMLAQPELGVKHRKKIAEIQEHAETYYEKFGHDWAYANFSRKFRQGDLGSLLYEGQENNGAKQKFVTTFFKRASKLGHQVGKVSWINDVLGENDLASAEKTLSRVADVEELDLFNKKTELSLAKLTSLALVEGQPAAVTGSSNGAEKALYDRKLELIDIQESITSHINLVIGNTIDDKAAEEEALKTFSNRLVAKSPGHGRLLKSAIAALLREQPLSPEALIDFLTLADPCAYEAEPEIDPDILGNEFYWALKVVDLSDLSNVHKFALRQVIWRRAMIRDDWTVINNTKGKSDDEVENAMQQSSIFRTLIRIADEAQADGSVTTGALLADLSAAIITPAQILAENAFPQVLQKRFEGAEKEMAAILKDMEREQSQLTKYVDKAQLSLHYDGMIGAVRDAVRDAAEEQGEEMAAQVQG